MSEIETPLGEQIDGGGDAVGVEVDGKVYMGDDCIGCDNPLCLDCKACHNPECELFEIDCHNTDM
jgi:hypothetical protein